MLRVAFICRVDLRDILCNAGYKFTRIVGNSKGERVFVCFGLYWVIWVEQMGGKHLTDSNNTSLKKVDSKQITVHFDVAYCSRFLKNIVIGKDNPIYVKPGC